MPKRATVVRCSRLHVFKCIEQVDSSSLKRNVFVFNWVRMMGPIFVVRIFKWLEKSIWNYTSRQIGYGETRFLVLVLGSEKVTIVIFFFQRWLWLVRMTNADWFASFCVNHVDLIIVIRLWEWLLDWPFPVFSDDRLELFSAGMILENMCKMHIHERLCFKQVLFHLLLIFFQT